MSTETKEKVAQAAATGTAATTTALEKLGEAGALMMATFDEDAGAGFEEAGASAYAIPFLKVLQSGSKQCKRANPEYIEGAYEGQLFNTVSGEVFDGKDGLIFVPAHFLEKYLEWEGTVDEGGGLSAQHTAAAGIQLIAKCTRDTDGYDRLPNNHIMQNIREHYGCFIHPVTKMLVPVVLSLASTQIKKSKKWMSQQGQFKRKPTQAKPDACYSHAYRLTTIPEKKDTFDYFGINIEHLGKLEEPIDGLDDPIAVFTQVKDFREMVKSGQAKPVADDEIPF